MESELSLARNRNRHSSIGFDLVQVSVGLFKSYSQQAETRDRRIPPTLLGQANEYLVLARSIQSRLLPTRPGRPISSMATRQHFHERLPIREQFPWRQHAAYYMEQYSVKCTCLFTPCP